MPVLFTQVAVGGSGGGGGVNSYVINVGTPTSLNPGDTNAYFFGLGATPTVTEGESDVYIPLSGTIKVVALNFIVSGVLGTAENSTITIHVNHAALGTVISSTLQLNVSSAKIANAAVNIAVVAADVIEFKWVTPAWVTNPTTVRIFGYFYIEAT